MPRGIAALLGWDSSPSQVTPSFCQVALTIGQYHFHSLEVRGTGRVKCLVLERDTVAQA